VPTRRTTAIGLDAVVLPTVRLDIAGLDHQRLGRRLSALLEARVYGEGDVLGIPFDHLALEVELDRVYLVDIGFWRSTTARYHLPELL
jgi:hypothetical protein